MVVQYLEKIRDKYIEENIHIKGLLNMAFNEKKENVEFIKLLEVNNDPNYESFTPREVNSFNKTKIAELQVQQKEIEEKILQYQEQISSIEKEIEEVTVVIKTARELENR